MRHFLRPGGCILALSILLLASIWGAGAHPASSVGLLQETLAASPLPTRDVTPAIAPILGGTPTPIASCDAPPCAGEPAGADSLAVDTANDNFADAFELSPVNAQRTIDFSNASGEQDEPWTCAPPFTQTVWYRYTAARPTRLVIGSTAMTTTPIVAAFGGTSLLTLTPLGCATSPINSITLDIAAGDTVHIQVADSLYTGGQAAVNFTFLLAPPNDDFFSATSISLPATSPVDARLASVEPGEPMPCGVTERSVWYRVSSEAAVALSVRQSGALAGVHLAAFTAGPTFNDLAFIACNGDGGSPLAVPIAAGSAIYIQASTRDNLTDAFFSLYFEALTPPPNDRWADAVVISSLPFTAPIELNNGSIEASEPASCTYLSSTVWYRYTATEDATLTVTTDGGIYRTIAAYTGSDLASLVQLGCAPYYPGKALKVPAAAGETVFVQVSGSTFSDATITFSSLPSPPNDAFANAMEIAALPFVHSVDVSGATFEPGESATCIANSVWYHLTAPGDMVIEAWVEATGPYFGTGLNIYRGNALASLEDLDCDSDGLAGGRTAVSAGDSIYIRAGSRYEDYGAELRLNVRGYQPPANDDLADARVVTDLPFADIVDTRGASVEDGEPAAQGCPAENTVWYAFTADEDTILTFDTGGSTFVPRIAVFDDSLAPIGSTCSDTALTVRIATGETVYVQAGGAPGGLVLHLDPVDEPANDDVANASVITELPHDATLDIAAATSEPLELPLCGGSTRTAWFTFTAPEDMTFEAEVFGPNPAITTYTGSDPAHLTAIECKTDYYSTRFQRSVAAGTTLYFQVGGEPYNSSSSLLHFRLEQIVPPANDDFLEAETIAALPFDAETSNETATTETGERFGCRGSTNGGNNTVWYVFTAPRSMSIDIAADGNHPGFLTVYNGTSLLTLTQRGCDDFSDANVRLNLSAGERIFIQLGAKYDDRGTVQLHVDELVQPSNDNFATAADIVETPFSTAIDTRLASRETGEPGCSGNRSVWYRYVAPDQVVLRINGLGSSSSAYFGVYRGSSLSGLTSLECDSNVNLGLDAGETVYIRASTPYQEGGVFQMNVDATVPVANDDFADATEITSLPSSFTVDINEATVESGERLYCGPESKTLWYHFVAPSDLVITVHATDENYNSRPSVAAFQGTSFDDLTMLGCPYYQAPADLQFKVTAGASVFFQVGHQFSSSDMYAPQLVTLDINSVTLRTNDDFANALDVGALPFTATTGNEGVTRQPDEPVCRQAPTGTQWYRFTVPDDTRFLLRSSAVDDGATLAAYVGNSLSTLELLNCASDYRPSITGSVSAGTTVYVQVGGTRLDEPFTLEFLPLIPPPNDNIADATEITSLPYDDRVAMLGATRESEELTTCGSFYNNTAWYRFHAAEDLTLRLRTEGGGATRYIVHGTDLPDAESEALCWYGDDQFPLKAGDTLFIQVVNANDFVDVHLESVEPPDNDRWQDARTIETLPFSDRMNTDGAGIQYGEPLPYTCSGMATTVWYTFTAQENTVLTVSTAGSDFDVVLAAYTESDGAPYQFLGCSDTLLPTDPERLRLYVSQGETVFVQAGGYISFTGELMLSVSSGVAPANDAFAHATTIEQLPFTDELDTSLASLELGETMGCWAAADTVWYAYTATSEITLGVDTHGSDHWTMLAAYVFDSLGYPPRARDLLACDGPGYLGYPPPVDIPGEGVVVFTLRAGETVYIQAANAGHGGDQLALHVEEAHPPVNDDVANAVEVSELPFSDATNTIGATAEVGEPACGYTPQHSSWYAYTAPRDLVLAVDTDGSDFDSALAAFTSSGAPSMPSTDDRIDCDTLGRASRLHLSLRAGERVLIQVHGRGRLELHMAIEREGLQPPIEVIALSPIAIEHELLSLRDALHDNFEPSVYDWDGASPFDLCQVAYMLRVRAGDIDGASRLNSDGDSLACDYLDQIPLGEIRPSDFASVDLDANQLSEHADGYLDGIIVVAFTLNEGPMRFTTSDGTWYSDPNTAEGGAYVCDATHDGDCAREDEFSFGREGLVSASLSGPLRARGDVYVDIALEGTDVVASMALRGVGDPVVISAANSSESRIETGGEARCGLPPYALPSGSIPEELEARAQAFDASLVGVKVVDSDGTALSNIPLLWTEQGGIADLSFARGFSSIVPLESASDILGANVMCARGMQGETSVSVAVSGAANAACTRERDGSNDLGAEVCFGRTAPVAPVPPVTFDFSIIGPPARMVLTADPVSVPCDGAHSTTIRAALVDNEGDASVAGHEVRFEVDGDGSVTPSLAFTDGGGVASTMMTPFNAGQGDITVNGSGLPGITGAVTVGCIAPTATPTSTLSPTATPTAIDTATATPTAVPAACVPLGIKLRTLLAIGKRLGTAVGDRRYHARYDLNADGVIDLADLGVAAGLRVCRGHDHNTGPR